jgi:hypothetical protein
MERGITIALLAVFMGIGMPMDVLASHFSDYSPILQAAVGNTANWTMSTVIPPAGNSSTPDSSYYGGLFSSSGFIGGKPKGSNNPGWSYAYISSFSDYFLPAGTIAANGFKAVPGTKRGGLTLALIAIQPYSDSTLGHYFILWRNDTANTIKIQPFVDYYISDLTDTCIYDDAKSKSLGNNYWNYYQTVCYDNVAGTTVSVDPGVVVREELIYQKPGHNGWSDGFISIGSFKVPPDTTTTSSVTITATLSPKGGYRYWLKAPASPTKIAVTISK